jgi:hypothetical protein
LMTKGPASDVNSAVYEVGVTFTAGVSGVSVRGLSASSGLMHDAKETATSVVSSSVRSIIMIGFMVSGQNRTATP